MYQSFFPLKMLFTKNILSINEFNYNSEILPLNLYYNGEYITSNYVNGQLSFVTKQDILRKKNWRLIKGQQKNNRIFDKI